jgi:hypothetical protein
MGRVRKQRKCILSVIVIDRDDYSHRTGIPELVLVTNKNEKLQMEILLEIILQ